MDQIQYIVIFYFFLENIVHLLEYHLGNVDMMFWNWCKLYILFMQ